MTLDDLGIPGDPVEDGPTFEDNALIKARWGAERSRAADAGRRLGHRGRRAGRRARACAPGATPASTPPTQRTTPSCWPSCGPGAAARARGARYVCVLAFLRARIGPTDRSWPGHLRRRIATAPRGSGGFGYDPIFEPASSPGRADGGADERAEKNAVSHRATAARAMAVALRRPGH